MFDLQHLPLGGGLVLTAAGYAAISYLVTGPLIGERTIARSGWAQACPAALHAGAARATTPTPRQNCRTIVGAMAQEFAPFCDLLAVVPPVEPAPRQTVSPQTRCACAASRTLDHRTAWALYAGSARLVTPPTIKALDSTLTQALHAPPCNPKPGGAS